MNLDDIIELDDDQLIEDPDDNNVDPTPEPNDPPESNDPPEESEDNNVESDPEEDETAIAYFEYLKENGVLDLPEDYEFDGTTEGIQEALTITEQQKQLKAYQNIWNHLPDDFKPLLDYALKGGTSLQEYLNVFAANSFDDYDLTDPVSQKLVIEQYYRLMNPTASDDKISK